MVGTLTPPYYAVIFTSVRTEGDNGYAEMAGRLAELAMNQPGFLGADSARSGLGITVSYWKDMESIRRWKAQADHAAAQRTGQEMWYASYSLRIAKVEKEVHFPPAS
ncbi:antibiotic biosynthesis monooxygenase [Desulfovibrio subterraneus]|uniref:antibiotic biosynthesis monooxygenase family protein n=1 Tax=Desulfovibrio subterraneus TaxID=2718620 RepID=UPI0022B91327|nr:antibiotic biosynthesis monooxygenase [Desulfovibrio subterraneus]WBF66737.1 antibiotic biosynthesis monooxygenase [Desulfovibrio subterraneus]